MINHDQLPAWIPGKMVASSEGLGWKGVSFRHYDYKPTTVDVPAMSEFLVIEYVSGHTRLDRNVEGQWKASDCYPGDLTLLTRSRSSQWHWTGSVGVRHAYITGDFLVDVADEVL
ncbi:MAG: AraC family transcriptional regulator, partial [Pseudomonadota bacterium]